MDAAKPPPPAASEMVETRNVTRRPRKPKAALAKKKVVEGVLPPNSKETKAVETPGLPEEQPAKNILRKIAKRKAADPLESSAQRTRSQHEVEVVIQAKSFAEQKFQSISLIPKKNATLQATQAAIQLLRSSAVVSENFYFGFDDLDRT